MSAKPPISKAKAVRVSDDLYGRMEQMADEGRKEGVSIIGITDRALRHFFERLDAKEIDAALTPITPEEEAAVRMVLDVFRKPYDRAEQSALKLLTDLYLHRLKK